MKLRFLVLLSFVILSSVGWSFAWSYLSDKSLDVFGQALEKAEARGDVARCDDPKAVGFPFRIGVACDNPRYASGDQIDIAASGLHAEAFVYRPNHQVVDFKSPADVKIGRFGSVRVQWKKARLGSEVSTEGVNAATIKLEEFFARPVNPLPHFAGSALKAGKVDINTRKTTSEEPPKSVVLGVRAQNIEVAGSGYRLPPIDGDVLSLIYDLAPVLDGKVKRPLRFWVDNGGELDLKGLSLRSGEAAIYASGWIKLDKDGFISADLDVDSANIPAFLDQLGSELNQFQVIGRLIDQAVQQLGSDVTLNEKPAKRFKVSIRRGFAKIGLLPIGNLPPINVSKL